jgi:cobalt/nickel transport system permease protein
MLVFVPLWAVHISDGLLQPSWLLAGWLLAGLLALVGAWRIREEDVPQTALLAAAFFVASQVHVRIGPTTAHLLLNGLLGVVLGRRAALAILVGLVLQAILFGHGGTTVIGVNAVVMTLPALAIGGLFRLIYRRGLTRRAWFRSALVILSTLLWSFSLVFVIALLWTSGLSRSNLDLAAAAQVAFHPASLAMAALLSAVVVWVERRLEAAPEFPLGLLLGQAAVVLTLLLHSAVLLYGGVEKWNAVVLLSFVAHLPVALIEGVVLGFAVGFLARVKPEMLGITFEEPDAVPGPLCQPAEVAVVENPATAPGSR